MKYEITYHVEADKPEDAFTNVPKETVAFAEELPTAIGIKATTYKLNPDRSIRVMCEGDC